MAKQNAWKAIRDIVGERDGFRCYYCKVPTGATIEHLKPRSKDGVHDLTNLVLACPSCNVRKGNKSLEEWKISQAWILPIPPSDKLGEDIDEMLSKFWKVKRNKTLIKTGSTNTRIIIDKGIARVEVRSGKSYPWHITVLGKEDNKIVMAGVYDILQKHLTPKK